MFRSDADRVYPCTGTCFRRACTHTTPRAPLTRPRTSPFKTTRRGAVAFVALGARAVTGGGQAWASRDDDGRLAIAAWNGTLDHTTWDGDRALARDVTLVLEGLPAGGWSLRHHRVDEDHSNIRRTWDALGGGDWPDDAGWARLHEADRLEPLDPERDLRTADDGRVELSFAMPMPSLSLIELVPRC